MNTCDTCEYWKFPIKKNMIEGDCLNPKNEPNQDGNLDGIRYDWDRSSTFTTGPKFGCIHHKPKDKP